ncbi:hypothetical protein AGMMS49574_11180 [Bacteroidia bacterium]|nr:hypothetical protein AGMMS49574_11180 [Bacteroidia bacterium]
MFYSDNPARYWYPESNKDATHGRFDLPHVVFYLSYDFGHGWKVSTEIEYEHGGAGSTYELEIDEAGEYETEIEKGGEIALEQFWIEKSFSKQANLRMGHVIVPVGLTNQYHFPTEFFSVLRPEEETAILPSTWHETGISFWGRTDKWRYEAQIIAGLDAERFNDANWIQNGSSSPYEFKIANQYAGAFRLDNYSVKGLRAAISGYFGFSARNSLKSDRYVNAQGEPINGSVTIGAFDAVYDDHHVLARTNVVYGHLGDSYTISKVNKKMPSASPSKRTDVASDVFSWYVEAGYDVLSFFPERKQQDQKLYVYGHYGYYNSMYKTVESISAKGWCEKTIYSAGLNYFPLRDVVIKAEYSYRQFKAPYNNEPTLSLGIAYSGLFM